METRPFKLSSYDISPSNNLADYYKQTVTTQYGTVADNRMSLTWNNVNLQQIVGDDFYNAYNRFTIKLVNQAWYGAPTSDSGVTYSAQNYQDQFVNVYLKGLPFYPPVYNSPDGALVNTLDTGILSTTVGGTVGRSNVSNSINQTFLKTSTANISINIRCVATEQPYSPADISTYIWGHSVYHFEITGISDVSNVSYIDLSNNTLLNYGQHSIYTELTPTDMTNYFASSNVTNINVLAYTSSISFSATIPTSIVYETNLTNILVTTIGVTQAGVTPEGTTRYYLDSVFTEEIFATTLLNYGSHTIYALFTPNSSDYANSSASTSLIVTQQSSTLTYSTLPSIVYGTTIESSLIASSSAPGTIQYYYDASYTQLVDIADIKDAGTYTIYAIYTSETNNYSSSSANSSLTIAVASTTLSYEPLSAITYPATIASSLTASSTVEGTVNYYLDSAYTQLVTSTNVLNAGTYTLYALFTPSSSNYSSSAANQSITVNKFAPTITLPTIASFVYETTLSDLVTGTTVDISAGTLSFYIGNETGTLLTSSTVLSVGSYTIFCKFTPTDTTNYLSASSTTSLTVTIQSTTIEFSSDIPTSFEYETTLANILNTTASNAGTVNYYYVSSGNNVAVTTSTVLQVGTYTIYAQLIPTNSDYASSTTSTSLTVTHKTVVMTYSNLPNIYYRTTASTSLNATVSPAIAGSFRYFTNVDQTGEVLPATLLNVNNYTIHAYFTPSNSNYTSAYASTSLIVNKFTPTIDLPPSSIVYGTQISSCFIAAISPSSIEGTTTYYLDSNHTDAIESTEVFSVGTYTLYALFTPTNTSNYATASTSETITVTKQPTTLTFPNISSFVYETTLENFITGTTVSGGVPGTFNFFLNNLSGTALSSSTVLETGVYTIFCQFLPTDTTNYSSTSATKSLTVNVLATTIVFSSSIPTTIVYGTTLAQLVNTVVTPNVTGTVRYYTNSNQTTEVFSTTILNVATYTLYAVFTPQMDDYATSSTSTQLSVTKATTTVTYPTLSAIAYGTSMNTSLTAYVSPSMQGVFNYHYVSPFFVNGTNKVSIGANDVLNSGTYTIFVNFVPSNSNYTGSTNSQSLTITATPTTVIYNTLPNIVYATTLASSLNATIYPNISGTMKYYIDADQVFPTTTLEVGTYSIRATFTPTSNNYVTSTTTKTLTINKIPTTITFPSLSSIVYQTTLTDIISSTSTGIPGTYSFRLNNATGLELSSTTVLETGTYTIFCKFEPTDSAHYSSSESTKSLVVTGLPTTLAYSPSIVSSIAYETTLADVLNTSVTPSIAGTTIYKIGDTVVTSSTVVDVGTYTITATFTPTDDDYAQSTVTTTLSVTALPTTLSFSIPSSIVYETTMNSSLTATCTKPGTIAYYYDNSYSSVVSGNNVPDVGTYTIYAVFTPSTANYLSSTASASLTVTQRATNIAFSQSVPTTITYETTLNEVLNTSLTSGTTTYYYVNTDSVQVDVSSTTVLSVGSYTITALFTPSSGNYTTSTATTSLLVSQKPIVVTYSGLPAITYGTTLSSSLNATLSQTVDGTLNYYTDNSLTSSVISTTVLNAGSYTIYAKFTPTSANYVSYVVNTNLTVNKATPIVTYGTLQPITYGATLQSSFTASASVGGTIAYFLLNDPIIGSQILNAGTYTLRAQFTPTDATNYESTFATSSLTVSKITPTITFASISTITYETSLSSLVSGTTASVEGTFIFYLQDNTILTSSTILNGGIYTIYASFTPTNTTNYTSIVLSSTSLEVQKKTTSITLSSITNITYGTTLSSFISGTTVDASGTLNFYVNNSSGQILTASSVLNAGTYSIYVSFTPTNSSNYFSSTGTKSITIQETTSSNDGPAFDVTKIMDNMSLWVDAKSSTRFDYDGGKQGWSDDLTKVVTHVAVGSGTSNSIVYSYDGIKWNASVTYQFASGGNCVATNGSIWLVGGQNPMAYSFDGINWISVPNTSTGMTTRTCGFAHGKDGSNNDMWVAVGTNSTTGKLATSFDGINWIDRGTLFTTVGNAVAWNASRWVAVGQASNTIMTSTNGINWTGLGSSIFSTAGYGITCANSMWVGVGQGTNTIAYSFNGTTWTGVTSSPFATAGYGVAYNGSMWVAVGQGGNSIAYSYDGIVWAGITGTTIFTSVGKSIAWTGTQWIAGGEGGNTMATSSNGVTWTAKGSSIFSTSLAGVCGYKTTNEVTSVESLPKHLITGAGGNSFGFMSNSTTLNALNRQITFSGQGNAVLYDASVNKWIAVGFGGNSIATSNDGFIWTGRGATTFTTAGNDVISDGTKYIAAGSGGNNIAISTDGGATWSGQVLSMFSSSFSVNYAVPANPTTSTTTYDATLTSSTVTVATPSYIATGVTAPVFVIAANGQTTTTANGTSWGTQLSINGSEIAYANGLFVAVGGSGTNNIATSTDGINWTGRGNYYANRCVAFGNNKWIAMGYESSVTFLQSTDGISWTNFYPGIFNSGDSPMALTYGNNMWVVVGRGWFHGNCVATSTDGTTWTGRGKAGFAETANGIAYGNNTWVAVGPKSLGTNTISTSSDASNWGGRGASIFTVQGNDVAYANNIWVAVGEGGNSIATSTDGSSWTGRTNSLYSGFAVKYGNGIWVVVGSGGIVTSPNGITWTTISSTITGYSIAFTNSPFTTPVSLAVSTDATNWTPIGAVSGGYGTNAFLSRANYVYGTAGSYVAVGSGGNTIAHSNDGINWVGAGATVFTTSGNGVYSNGSIWVAVGQGGNTIATSTDRITWTGRGATVFTTRGNKVVWNTSLNIWIATGQGGNTVATSADGITWVGRGTTLFSTAGYGIARSGPSSAITLGRGSIVQKTSEEKHFFFVSVGAGGNTFSYSSDGKTWTGRGLTVFTSKGNKIAHNGTMYVAVGQGGNTIAYSYEGVNLTGAGATVFTTAGYGIGYNSYMWVAVGQGGNTVATSTNGVNWTGRSAFSTAGYNVTWANNQWMAVGEGGNTISSSIDGITWTGREASVIFTKARGIAYGAGRWVAVGEGANHTMATSTDGIIWTGLGKTTFTSAGNNITWNGSRFVAVGQGGNTVATSTNGTTWFAVSGTTFATYGSDIEWCYNMWMATGSDPTNYYLGSVDGLIWTALGKGTNTTEVVGVGGYAYVNKVKFLLLEGSATSVCHTSFDGMNWIRRTTSATQCNYLTYINNTWVAATLSGLLYSTDGISWKTSPIGIATSFVTFGNGMWLALGTLGQISTSLNLITWTTRTSPFNSATHLLSQAAFWNGSLWIALSTGTSVTMARSTDGITWTAMGKTTFTTSGQTVLYANGLWVAGGVGGNSIATSVDGITWTGRASGVTDNVRSIAWNGSLFVAGCSNATTTIITSPDGITWTSRGNLLPTPCVSVVWTGTFWIAASQSNALAYSSDGITWSLRSSASVTSTMAMNPNINYPNVVKVYDKSSLSNNSTRVVDDIKTNFLTSHRIKENIINGYPALQLVRSGFTSSYTPSYTGEVFSFFTVIKFNMMYNSPRFLSFGPGSVTNDASLNTAFIVSGTQTSATSYAMSLWRNNVRFPISDIVLGTPYLISGYFTGSTVHVGVNGVYTTYDCSGNFNIQRIGVGVNTFDNSGSTHDTDYGEIMAFSAYPSSAQRQTLEGYLAQKWGLLGSLPNNHPYSNYTDTVSPIFIPQSNNSGYAGRIVETYPTSYYPIVQTGTKIGNYASLERYHNDTLSGYPIYDANIIDDESYSSTNKVAVTTSDKKFGTMSLAFPGTSHSGKVSLNPLTLSNGNSLTLSAWVKFTSLDSVPRTILSLANSTDSIKLAATATNYLLYRGDMSFSVPVTPATNTWTHVVASNSNIRQNTWTVSIDNSASQMNLTRSLKGLYVAVGGGSIVATSLDGIDWTSSNININAFMAITCGKDTFGEDLWVAGGSGSAKLARSSDGINWTAINGVFTNYCYAIAYQNNLWVAVGGPNMTTIATSTDGISWTSRNLNPSSGTLGGVFTDYGTGIAYGNNMWVATGVRNGSNGNTIASSPDGITWTGRSANTIFSTSAWGVAYGNGLWVTVGQGTFSIATSTDGITWTGRSSNGGVTNAKGAAYANGLWVIVGSGTNTIATSTDGITWTGRTGTTVFSTSGQSVFYNNGLWFAAGYSGNTIATSVDGITWTGRKTPLSLAYSVAFGPATTTILPLLSNTANNIYTTCAIGSDASSSTMKMDGFIDDVRIYNSTLSKAQISQVYGGKVDANALVSHYTYDSIKGDNETGYSIANFASGSIVYDASITNVNLQTTVGNRLGVGCLYFPSTGYTGNVTLGNIDMRADPSNSTFSTWVNFSSLDLVPRTIFSLGQNNRVISLAASYQNYTFTYKTATSTRFVNLPGPNLDTWNHVAVAVTNDVSNSWAIYVNGAKTSYTVDSSFSQPLPTIDFGNVYTANYIGIDTSVNRMHGYVDDTRFYNRGLTDAEVLNIFNTDYVFTVETVKSIIPIGAQPTTITMSSLSTFVYGTTMSNFINGTTASADGTLNFYVNDASGQQLTSSTVLNAGTYTIYTAFTPTDPSSFMPSSATKSLTVEQVATSVNMSSIETFAYGTTMASFMSGTTSVISGTTTPISGTKTFYINDPSGQLLVSSTAITVGTFTIYCKFNPTSTNYSSSFATKQLVVTQKQITITYGPLAAITYGTKLTSRLTASSTPVADGSMNYYINGVQVTSATVLDASSHIITATFTPASSNYIGASTTSSIVVNKATTVVTYPIIQSVFFNAPIGTGPFSATATPTIDGTMAYFTNSNFTNQVFSTTTLAQGTYTMYARFTPASTNYTISSASSSLLVKGITTPTITFPSVTTVAAYTTLESFINTTTVVGVDGTYVFRKTDSNGEILTITSTFNVLGNFVVFCSFTPTNTELYLPTTSTYTVIVKYTPTFLFNQRPSSTITYGTNLSGSVLASTVGQFNNANIPGTITFSNNLTTASFLTPGIYTVTATFTPTNLSEYNVVTTTKQILVNKQDIIVMITTPSVKSAFIKSAPITCTYQIFGIVSSLNDTFENSISGTIVNKYMTSDESQVLTAQYVYNTTFSGASQNYKISADIQGFSSTKYNFTAQSYTFTINKITPTIGYTIASTNKTLTYGTKLSENQLNAVVSYNGTPVTTGSVVYTRSVFNLSQTVNSQTELDVGQYNLYAYYSDPIGNIYNSVNTSTLSTNQVTIVKATPTVFFPNIKSILAGTDLISLLDYTFASHKSNIIDGAIQFSYVNQSGATVSINALTILPSPPSSYTILASFSPTDTTRYNIASGSTTLLISDQSTTTSAVAKLQTPFIYGKTFNDLYTISASPSIAGTYAYYDDVIVFDPTNVIDAGTYTGYTVVFNPASTVYASSLVNVTFTIENANVALTYATPPSFAFQTANSLSLVQPTMTPVVDGQMQIFLDSLYTNELTRDNILEIGTHTLYVRFTPTKNYNVATVTTTLTVTKIPTSLLHTTQTSNITYGDTNITFLSNSVVGGIEGVISYYYDASYTLIATPTDVLNFGTHTIYTKFEPTDTIYASSFATHTVNVAKTSMTITYPILASITYGDTLASSFTASSTVDGSVNYFINSIQIFANTQLNAGTYTIQAVFTPSNPINYSTASVSSSRTLTVAKQPTEIIYAPSSMIGGASFESSMTATVRSNIPGIFRYFNGTEELFSSNVLSAGNYNIYVTFTPSNLSNFSSSSITVPLTIITNIQYTIMTDNTQQILTASNNQLVSIVTQNELLPPTMDVKINVLPPGETSFISTSTSSTVSGLQFNFVDSSLNSSVRIVVSALTVSVPGASNSPAIFFKIYDENGNSVVNQNNRVLLTLNLPQYKGIVQYLYLLRLQEVGSDFDGTRVPLTPVNPTDSQNTLFTGMFTSNSVYVGSVVPPPSNSSEGVMLSNMYTFSATGGFVMERGFDDIKYREEAAVEVYDVTDSVQVLFDVAFFNTKLGITKNPTNTQLITTQFNPITDQFESNNTVIDSVTMSSIEFANGLVKPAQIISVGRYSTLYTDFKNYVGTYFGFDGGFSSLFSAASEFSIDGDNEFDSTSMLTLLTGESSEASGAYISDLSGQITIVNITKSLRHAVNSNCFGNRNPMTGGTAVDPANSSNYGVGDGFVAGDLVWVNTGTLVKLNLNIDTEGFNPLNNVGPQNTLLQVTNYSSGNFSRETVASTTNINRSVRAPLLLKLVNASTISAL